MEHLRSILPVRQFIGGGFYTAFRFALLVTVAGAITTAAAMSLLARNGDLQLPDPFVTNAAIFPGERVDFRALEAQGFTCKDDTRPTLADIAQLCSSFEGTDQLSAVTVALWDGVVARLDLQLRESALSIGDLTLLWGNPEIHQVGQVVSLRWRERHINATGWSYGGRFTYFQPVLQLSFG